MEQVKAPEKLYVSDIIFDYVDTSGSTINTIKVNDFDVEYIRTDAFIEKACEFLDGCIPDYIDLKHANVDNKRFIDEFRNYMKGE